MKKIASAIAFILALTIETSCFAEFRYIPIESTSGMKISFGAQLDAQEDGYSQLEGKNIWLDFLQSKSEIPDEVPVLDEFIPNGENIYYVATDGSDTGLGTKKSPFATVNKALATIKELPQGKKAKGSVIYLMGGIYSLEESIKIDKEMCDVKTDAPLYISAYPGEEVIINDASTVTADKFQLVTEENTSPETIARMADGMLGKMYYTDYANFGIDKLEGFVSGNPGSVPALYMNGVEQTLSRYPNSQWLYIEKVVKTPSGNDVWGQAKFIPEDKECFNWQINSTIAIYNQVCVNWAQGNAEVTINKKDGTIDSLPDFPYGMVDCWLPVAVNIAYSSKRSHFYFRNIFETLDMETEWCGDDAEKRFYFYPSGGEIPENALFTMSNNSLTNLVECNNAENVVINNIAFENATNGITMKNCSQVVVQNCKIENIGINGVTINHGHKCGVLSSTFSSVGLATAISGVTWGEMKPERNFVQDCIISDAAKGVTISGIGNIFSHNNIESISGNGSVMTGVENIMEYNDMVMIAKGRGEDSGSYLGGNALNSGNHRRYNYIHDMLYPIMDDESKGNSCGMAVDDMGEQQYHYGNIFENCKQGIAVHSGDNMVHYDNVFIDCSISINNSDNYGRDVQAQAMIIPTLKQLREGSVVFSSYENNNLYNNDGWTKRVPLWHKEYEYYSDLGTRYLKGEADEDDAEFLFARANTGVFYINNTYVNSGAPGPSDRGKKYMHTDIDVVSNPDADINYEYSGCWNVLWGNEERSSFDITTLPQYSKMGTVRNSKEKNEYTPIKMLDPTEKEVAMKGDVFALSWNPNPGCNWYRVLISNDEFFDDIEYAAPTYDTFFEAELEKSKMYYVKVLGYDIHSESKVTPVSESEVLKVDFESTYVPYSDFDINYGTPVIDGDMDEIYLSAEPISIPEKYNSVTNTSKRTNSGNVYFLWDFDYLYVYAKINDDEVTTIGYDRMFENSNPWYNDALEMYLSDKKVSVDAFNIRTYTHNDQLSETLLASLPISTAITKNGSVVLRTDTLKKEDIYEGYKVDGADGYVVEMALPLSKLIDNVQNDEIVTVKIQNNDIQKVQGTYAAYAVSSALSGKLVNGPEVLSAVETFTDLDSKQWYRKSVNNLYKKKLISGTSDTLFSPNDTMTRAMFMTILSRYSGEADISGSYSSWYEPHIAWAKKTGITDGVFESDSFDPNKEITREEMAMLLYNYGKYINAFTVTESTFEFADQAEISEKALSAVKDLYARKVMQGDDSDRFRPKDKGTRAEACEVISNWIENIEAGPGGFILYS